MTTDNPTSQAIDELTTSMQSVCCELENMFTASEESKEAVVMLIRALQREPTATAEVLAEEWAVELGDHPVDDEAINMALELHRLFGAEWYVICAHFRMRERNEDCRGVGETVEDCPLLGDDVDEVREIWADHLSAFEGKRASEEAAARVWLARQAKKKAA